MSCDTKTTNVLGFLRKTGALDVMCFTNQVVIYILKAVKVLFVFLTYIWDLHEILPKILK
jgi:hypothetical protein